MTFTFLSHKVNDMNTQETKKEFAIFDKNPDLIYMDSAATSLTPKSVVEKFASYHTDYDANVARGTYKTSALATELCEISRTMMAQFLSADPDEVVFTSGTTASLNMIAHGLAHHINPGNEIITTKAEHHANFVPWQVLAKENNAHFITTRLESDGKIDIESLIELITDQTKILTLAHISNVLGTVNPIKEIIQRVRAKNPNIIIVVDAAQSAAHMQINVKELDCDFLALSLHKLFGPTGVGVLYGKKEELEKLTPIFTGGEMIEEVTSTCTTYTDLPHRLEAGTPNIAGIIAVQAALKFVNNVGFEKIHAHESDLVKYCMAQLQENFGDHITILGPANPSERSNVISFTFKNYHPHDIASILDDKKNIAIRAGQHCAMPLHLEGFKTRATARVSLSIYNTKEDIDLLIDGLREVDSVLS